MKLNGCHNLPREGKPLLVQDGWIYGMKFAGELTRLPRMVTIPFVNSLDCRYEKRFTDPGCKDCEHGK
jgi:hypothetical protein